MNLNILNRKVHYWAALLIAVPFLIVLVTGILLQLKKELEWIQPPGQRGSSKEPAISFTRILEQARSVPQAEIQTWDDIDRLDVRPSRGMVKVRSKNQWEIQIDTKSGDILQVAFRRSDIIEAIHDGSWFHESAKLYVFLPAAVILVVMWITGMYLFWLPIVVKRRRKRRKPNP